MGMKKKKKFVSKFIVITVRSAIGKINAIDRPCNNCGASVGIIPRKKLFTIANENRRVPIYVGAIGIKAASLSSVRGTRDDRRKTAIYA